MNTIRTLLTDDHRHCDDLFSEVEEAVAAPDPERARSAFARCSAALLAHFEVEETLLFPAFEARTGMCQGPTEVMRQEHRQLRRLLADIEATLQAGQFEDYLGLAETALIMMQQHNMKEENILYPMCDQHLEDELKDLLPAMGEGLHAA